MVPFAFHRLFQQFVVDAWALCDQSSLSFIRYNQSKLRAEVYNGVTDAIAHVNADPADLGRRVILPSSFLGGQRFIKQCYQDFMAIVRKLGRPSLFITFTANPRWKEITQELREGETGLDRFDLAVRVFHLKAAELRSDLRKKNIFGRYKGCVWTVEYQKRGLPHMHYLLFLHPDDREQYLEPVNVDRSIRAEIPTPEEDPDGQLRGLVHKFMLHRACGVYDPNSPCMAAPAPGQSRTCSKRFPKRFRSETVVHDDGYPEYVRRDDGQTLPVMVHGREVQLDNGWVVPYNP